MIFEELCFIIPTKDRIEMLNRLLKSIYSQNILPKYIIVVDGSVVSIENEIFKDLNVQIIYARHFPPSLTAQRNLGISLIPKESSLVGFLDDDLVFLEDASKNILNFFAEDTEKKVGGASFNLSNSGTFSVSRLSRFFLTSSTVPGKFTKAGTSGNHNNPNENMYTEWLCGGATVWRKQVFEEFRFDEWFKGYALYEDADFSYRVSLKWKLAIVKDANVLHLHVFNTLNSDALKKYGDLEIVDRLYFAKKYPNRFSYFLSIWSCVGTTLMHLWTGLKFRDKNFLVRSKANFYAIIRCVFLGVKRKKYNF